MAEPHVAVDRDGTIAIVRLNRPVARNAISKQMLCLLEDAWDEIEGDDGVRAAVLTGEGGAFSTGGDLKSMDADDRDGVFAKRFSDDPDLAFRGILRTRSLSKPLVAAVEGPAVAGGMELLLSTDVRIAAEGATFGMPEVVHGIFPLGGSTVRLPHQVSYPNAMHLLLTGELIDAREAHRIGLVGKVVADGHALVEATRVAGVIADNAPLAVQAVKRSVRTAFGLSEENGLRSELEIGGRIFDTEDAREGVRAFAEKRKPKFQRR